MMSTRSEDIELHAAREQWRRLAVMQGLLCVSCREAPSLERRHAFYDTGLCETCATLMGGEGDPGAS